METISKDLKSYDFEKLIDKMEATIEIQNKGENLMRNFIASSDHTKTHMINLIASIATSVEEFLSLAVFAASFQKSIQNMPILIFSLIKTPIEVKIELNEKNPFGYIHEDEIESIFEFIKKNIANEDEVSKPMKEIVLSIQNAKNSTLLIVLLTIYLLALL